MPARVAFVVPGGLGPVTGGNVYDRAAITELERRGWVVDVVEPGHAMADPQVTVVDSLALRFGRPSIDGPVVALVHQLPSDAEGRPEWGAAEAATLSSANLVVTVSEGLARRVGSLTGAPVVAIPPGWDRAGIAAPGHRDSVLCVANAHRGKGLPESVEAFARSGVDLELVVVGDWKSDEGEAQRVRAAARRSRSPVHLVGVVPPEGLAVIYARARAFITASTYEGWPIAVAEAMAGEVPIVGFQAPGVTDLVRSGVDGILVPMGDLEALAGALSRVVEDPNLAERMGRAARARARGWPTWQDTARRFADRIETVAAGEEVAPRPQATGAR
jgi:glycosyltransferase involved in cell wall biosynthesis